MTEIEEGGGVTIFGERFLLVCYLFLSSRRTTSCCGLNIDKNYAIFFFTAAPSVTCSLYLLALI